MNLLSIIIAALSFAGVAGGVSAWYRKGQGQDTLKLAETTIALLKEESALKDRKILYQQGQMDNKDQIIEGLLDAAKNNSRKKR